MDCSAVKMNRDTDGGVTLKLGAYYELGRALNVIWSRLDEEKQVIATE